MSRSKPLSTNRDDSFDDGIVAVSDEFAAILNEAGDVDIFDGENVIRLTMSYDVWCEFTVDAIQRRSY